MPKAKKIVQKPEEQKPEDQKMEEQEMKMEEKPVVVKEKKKRAPSAYNLFVQQRMKDFAHLPPKERMREVAKLYKESKKKP